MAAVLSFGIAQPDDKPREVTVRGRVVCLDASGTPFAQGAACDPSAGGFTRFGLDSGESITAFSPEDTRSEIFTDPRVRERELEVRGWFRGDGRFEITKVFSLRNGRLHDLYYFCSVCNITSHRPGPCWCCRADFELKEEPARNP